jgi:hypothetical protein
MCFRGPHALSGWTIQDGRDSKEKSKKLRRITVNKTSRILFCCALALILVSFAAAADKFNVGGLQGVHTDQGKAILPPAPIYTNCGTGCTSYDTGDGYFVAGTGYDGQVLAVSFTTTKKVKLTKVISAGSCYDGTSDCGKNLEAVIQKDSSTGPGKVITTKVVAKVPIWPTSSPLTFKFKKPVALKAKTKYWLCEQMKASTGSAVAAWMLSSSDTSSDFYFQDTGSCVASTWNDADGDTRPAFEIN